MIENADVKDHEPGIDYDSISAPGSIPSNQTLIHDSSIAFIDTLLHADINSIHGCA